MGSGAVSGAASGAALGTSVLPGWGTAIGAGLGAISGILSDNAAKKRAQAIAAYKEKQAQRTLDIGKAKANATVGQGQMDQTTLATKMLSTGGATRAEAAADSSLSEIANRAQNEATSIMEQANYDAQNIRDDISAMNQDTKDNTTAGYINAATSILGAYGAYNKNKLAAQLATR